MKMRVSKVRKDFGSESISYIEREAAGEQPFGNKSVNNNTFTTKRKVLEIGLQAANQIQVTDSVWWLQLYRGSNPRHIITGW